MTGKASSAELRLRTGRQLGAVSRPSMVWKTQALCATVRPKQSEVCHEPIRGRRPQRCGGHGESIDGLCAAAPAHGRAAAADRGAWRPVLHGVRPGRRCGNRRGDPGRARGDRRGRGPARYRHDRQGTTGPDQDQMGPRVPRPRRVCEVHPPVEHHQSPGRRPGAAAALYGLRAADLLRRPVQRPVAGPGARRHCGNPAQE